MADKQIEEIVKTYNPYDPSQRAEAERKIAVVPDALLYHFDRSLDTNDKTVLRARALALFELDRRKHVRERRLLLAVTVVSTFIGAGAVIAGAVLNHLLTSAPPS